MRRRFTHRALFHFRNSRWHRDNDARSRAHPAIVHFRDEMSQHRLCYFEIGNDAILEWTHRDNVCRRAAKHALGFVTYRQHSVRAGLHRHDRWLAQNNPLILYVNKGVRGAQIDPDVAGEPAEKSIEHELVISSTSSPREARSPPEAALPRARFGRLKRGNMKRRSVSSSA